METGERVKKPGANGRLTVPLRLLVRDIERFLPQIVDERAKQEAGIWLRQVTANENLDQEPRLEVLQDFIRLCVQLRLHLLLAAYQIPHPSYNYFGTFEEDNAGGPWDSPPQKLEALTPAVWSVLGFDVGFPIGVPASVLTATADWIDYYARHGFNILTYKTVRSQVRKAHPEPNWVFLQGMDQPLTPGQIPDSVKGELFDWPNNPRAFSMANSFGVPSFPPERWQPDVKDALSRLRSDQLLIVSVMATYEECQSLQLVVEDFVRVSKMAEEAGAPAIELNLSCPNTVDPATGTVKKDLICESPVVTEEIVTRVRSALKGQTRLVIKLGYMGRDELKSVVVPLFKGGPLIQGISGINTIQMKVLKADGKPTFVGSGQNPQAPREKAGVSGIAIREYGLDFVRSLAAIRQEHGLDFDIIGMGGVMCAADVDAYQRAGASAVQTATAAFFNANLPQEIIRRMGAPRHQKPSYRLAPES